MSGAVSIKCQWTQSLCLYRLIQHNPPRVLRWVVSVGPVPELYQINIDQRLGLIIIFVYLSAFFFFFFFCPILLSSPEALSHEKLLLKQSNENICFTVASSCPTCCWVEGREAPAWLSLGFCCGGSPRPHLGWVAAWRIAWRNFFESGSSIPIAKCLLMGNWISSQI